MPSGRIVCTVVARGRAKGSRMIINRIEVSVLASNEACARAGYIELHQESNNNEDWMQVVPPREAQQASRICAEASSRAPTFDE